ncbi:MAG: NERD domain-containing protein [Clostridium celatum]|nr:NERD domain-containing protein [Clostridium celatum]MDU4979514.1 NERD domain-containing protein [Clostridium celatum]
MELIIVLVVIVLIVKFKSPNIKGSIGERKVSKALNILDNNEYKIINNLMIRTDRGTTQIDHVVISVYGIFVIETKNYQGFIFGNENDDKWKQVIDKRSYKFRNPIMQNYGHVVSLRKRLNLDKDLLVVSLIAFTNRASLRVNTQTPVMYDNNIVNYIRSYREKVISENYMMRLYYDLLMSNIDSKDTRKEHVENIRMNLRNMENSIRNNVCPRCGKELVRRNGKHGQFIGCSGFPRCRFVR